MFLFLSYLFIILAVACFTFIYLLYIYIFFICVKSGESPGNLPPLIVVVGNGTQNLELTRRPACAQLSVLIGLVALPMRRTYIK